MQKNLTPSEKRELVVYSATEYGISTRNACRVFTINSSVFYYKKKKNNEMIKSGRSWFYLQTSIRRGDYGQCTTVWEIWVSGGITSGFTGFTNR
ncbi:hypothetical protein [Chryseobacterium sp. CY350]|uniref:hypothetical protein n=1 Tax=Chryseobacterium sp. CY350 TaxID=2997336 RepID=UPI002271689F|nr:hypothetical protein [Chryseobacterium sp. CY350]